MSQPKIDDITVSPALEERFKLTDAKLAEMYVDIERLKQALRDITAPPVGALPLYFCPVCHQCLTAAAYRTHLPGNHPPGAADYHRRHGLNMQEGHLQAGFLDCHTGEFLSGLGR